MIKYNKIKTKVNECIKNKNKNTSILSWHLADLSLNLIAINNEWPDIKAVEGIF